MPGKGWCEMVSTVDLRCEYAANPLGIDSPAPRFSWKLRSEGRAQVQAAYQVLVASRPDRLAQDAGDKWDSGRVVSDRSVNVPYAGRELAGAEACWWKVRAWDGDGRPGPWSAPATFEMGLLKPGDWQGKWIAAAPDISAPLLRKEFTVGKTVRRARVYICGLGWHELRLNGAKVGDHEVDPAPTWYDNVFPFPTGSRALYVTHDVTALLARGANALGVILGRGWYSSDTKEPSGRKPFADRPILMLRMTVEFDDGGTVTVASDESWRTSAGPITANDLCAGEHYDARLEQPGWDAPGFDDSAWAPAGAVKPPSGRLVAQSVEPARITHRFPATRMLRSGADSVIFDIGQYISGWTELRVAGPKGTKVAMRHAGRVNYETSSLDTRNNCAWHESLQTDSYILKGEGVEVWRPRFTIHGFRYVELIGYPGEPALDAVVGCAVNSDIETSGRFECSNDLLNRIHHNICWTFRGSFHGIPQDAADRAERVAWLGDPGFVAEDYMLNFNDVRFWEKWLDDIRDSQKENGDLPFISPPNWGEGSYKHWPCWECSYALFIWHCYRYHDDVPLLANHYAGLKKQADCFHARAQDGILPEHLGDHMEPSGEGGSRFAPILTPADLTGTAYHYFTTRIAAQAAAVLGHKDDAARFAARAEEIKAAFNRKFFDPGTDKYAKGSQTSQALALYLDLVPEGHADGVLKNLVAEIVDKCHGRLMTGIIGTDALAQALPKCGRTDVMYGIATATAFPSWGYGVTLGQTTLSEDFECGPRHSVSMKMFGSAEKYFYRDVAGINLASPGYRTVVIRPRVVGDLTWAKASIESVRGVIAVDWKKGDWSFTMTVTVPPNATAEVHVPKLGLKDVAVTEGGKALWKSGAVAADFPGVTGAAESEESVAFNIGSGSYMFELTGRK